MPCTISGATATCHDPLPDPGGAPGIAAGFFFPQFTPNGAGTLTLTATIYGEPGDPNPFDASGSVQIASAVPVTTGVSPADGPASGGTRSCSRFGSWIG
ncbi:hypothetical protein [Kitasatospora kifunensis]|uniref:Uncharacterized protein n=1 Tax=Kitasatospora kifunensis TaxID=58351 RepID=A0A7W7RA19_KITKI|nr:hypothetical protein [Kitasatospora kifunensis]MBB4928173.1 hypothetical protein [Kitasatospora kifunensis]